ncbi:ANTAR domain-containing protein [Streptomyces sp. NRRL B-11253]|uniref:ANTAR domain-containing protein n=1 Tax=Streptomyces sp. NRRL B-11253 TaxID=1463826 RepID=UPI00067B6F30|nr:ANTAR domain-containing protein [Streptomyces sp. NRRL B-11253]
MPRAAAGGDGAADTADPEEPGAAVERLRAENARLRRALAGRPVIEQARGILMATEECTADQAWDILRQTSQHANLKVREIAGEVVADATGTVPPGPVRTHLREAVRQHRAGRRKAS